jgi:hypothetical protein
MSIKFLNSLGKEVSETQAYQLGEYVKIIESNGMPKIKYKMLSGQCYHIKYYKDNSETELQVVNTLVSDQKPFSIIEVSTVLNNHRLEKSNVYSPEGLLVEKMNILYNVYDDVVATEVIVDVNLGTIDYDYTKKYYYDPAINPKTFLFQSYFDENGSFEKIYYNSLHTDPDEQDSEVFLNTPQDIQRLRDLTGISQQLANYYLSPNVIP